MLQTAPRGKKANDVREADAAELATGRDVVVGTPSSIKDLVRKGQLRLDECRFLVLHEAAELLEARPFFHFLLFLLLPTGLEVYLR